MKNLFSRLLFKKSYPKNVDDINHLSPKTCREYYETRKQVIDDWLEEYQKCKSNEYKKYITDLNTEIYKENSICPKCGGGNIVNHFTPKKLNCCKDCTHEWEYEEPLDEGSYDSSGDAIKIGMLLNDVCEILNISNWGSYCKVNKFLYTSEDDMTKQRTDVVKKKYSDVINDFPIEIIYYYGVCNLMFITHKDDVFYKEDSGYHWTPIQKYIGEFKPDVKKFLLSIGIKQLDIKYNE